MQHLVKRAESDDESTSVVGSSTADDAFAADLGFRRLQKQRKKMIMKRKQKQETTKTSRDELNYSSAVTMGHLKRAEVDWDWDDDGKATDDEDEDPDKELDVPEGDVADFQDASDEEGDVLTQCGHKLTNLLANQKETEADEELAEFSDDEEMAAPLAEGAPPSSEPQVAEPAGPAQRKTPPVAASAPTPPLTREAIKQKIGSALARHGGRMPIRKFMETFSLTQKNDQFKLVQQALNEMCDLHTENIDGLAVKVLELKATHRW
eukprot:Polyplicarium_translucidae@DN2884_c0_g1_i4.p1